MFNTFSINVIYILIGNRTSNSCIYNIYVHYVCLYRQVYIKISFFIFQGNAFKLQIRLQIVLWSTKNWTEFAIFTK